MFEGLQEKFQEVFRRLRGEGRITQEHLASALKELRLALLEADVHFASSRTSCARVEEKALGEKVLESLSPGAAGHRDRPGRADRDVRGARTPGSCASTRAPSVLLLCGLQGSGKTTTAGKLGRRLAARGRYPLLVAGDLQRAAAVEQLIQVGATVDLPVLTPQPGESVVDLGRRAIREARERGRDVVVLDTAGRLHVDEELMAEVAALAAAVAPREILYRRGRDDRSGRGAQRRGVRAACSTLTGVVLTKLDGDTRGGAALSIREVAQVPIRFVGVGEKSEELELFSPARMASRILGMGDVLSA